MGCAANPVSSRRESFCLMKRGVLMHAILMSLRAFAVAGLRPRTPLARGIAATLALKLCVVVALRLFVFGGDDRVRVDPSLMDDRLSPAVTESEGN